MITAWIPCEGHLRPQKVDEFKGVRPLYSFILYSTTPFDMTVLNELDRFHLVCDVIDRVDELGSQGVYLKQQMQDKLVEHQQYISEHGQDMPEILQWRWPETL